MIGSAATLSLAVNSWTTPFWLTNLQKCVLGIEGNLPNPCDACQDDACEKDQPFRLCWPRTWLFGLLVVRAVGCSASGWFVSELSACREKRFFSSVDLFQSRLVKNKPIKSGSVTVAIDDPEHVSSQETVLLECSE